MKLLIVSDMAHYASNNQTVGHGPTAREISHLAQLFEEVTHIGCLYRDHAPNMMLPYDSDRIRFVPVPATGGSRLIDKLNIIVHMPQYVAAILNNIGNADVIHVRCPANIPLMAIILLALLRQPKLRWIKYAGNWRPVANEPVSYRFQRWWLSRNFARAVVTVNGQWSDSPSHIHAFRNPCLTDFELIEGEEASRDKQLCDPMHFIFVGRLDISKGVANALYVVMQLIQQGYYAQFDIIGDGPDRTRLENTAKKYGIYEFVKFHGWKPRAEINSYYRQAHFLLFPSSSEGWPKVLSEAMAYGVVPLASNVGSIHQYLTDFGTGRCFSPNDVAGYVKAVKNYSENPGSWKRESIQSVKAARMFSYDSYIRDVRELLDLK